MKRPAYDSPSLPITWDRVEYVEGQNEYIPIRPEVKKNIDQMYAQADSALENGNPEAMNELKEQFGENPYELKNILKYCSFYAFAIWVGMGVAGIIRMLRDYCKMKEVPAAALASVLCLLVPIQMAGQTWDDHDRSGRFVARDFGQNYLMTLQEEGNPIIFTNGDNDTFPLWYKDRRFPYRCTYL